MSIGSAGDLFPMLSIALALRARDQRVTVLGPEQHRPYVQGAGLDFHGVAVDEAVLDDPRLWHPRHGTAVVWQATRAVAAALPAFVEALPAAVPCVLVVHPLALAEADLCRAARPDLRIAAVFLAPSNLPTVHDPLVLGPLTVPRWMPLAARRWLWRRIGASIVDPAVLPHLNDMRRQRGLAPVRHALPYLFSVADLSLALFPSWFGATQPDWPQPLYHADFPRYDPHPDAPLSAELAAFLAAGDAPVLFTPGTGNRQAAAYFSAALRAIEALGRRAIFLTPFEQQIPARLPGSVLWQAYVPVRALLPRAAGLVHHGGIGTTAEALASGTVQLVIPFAHDQFDNAARVAALGCGVILPAARLSARRLQRRLRLVLSSPSLALAAHTQVQASKPAASLDKLCIALMTMRL